MRLKICVDYPADIDYKKRIEVEQLLTLWFNENLPDYFKIRFLWKRKRSHKEK